MKANVTITYRDKDNNIIENPTDGQMSYSPETGRMYQWVDAESNWKLIDGDVNLGMTEYDLNKQIVGQLPVLEGEGLETARSTVKTFVEEINQEYYMLLCRELNYYTVFQMMNESENNIVDEVIACSDYIGYIKSIERLDGAVEVWVTERDNDKETYVMYFFPYDAGVIKCTL